MCYIIKEWSFYINHFSLIIFYHSVWLGFELFGIEFRCSVIGHSFTLVRKGYDNHRCHNKLPDRKWAEVCLTSCTEEMVLRIWRFWKRVSWRLTLDHGVEKLSFCHWGSELSFLLLRRRLSLSGLDLRRWIDILNITICAERWNGVR